MTESEIISIAQDAQELIGKIDPAILKAATIGVATAIGKVAGEAGIKLLGSTGDNLLDGAGNLTKAAQDLLFRISQKYIANYTERHGTLKVLGMGKPVSLDSVYTKVNFQSDTTEQPRPDGLDVANKEKYLMVLGNPGTSKTIFLQKVGLEALKGRKNGEYQHDCIPVFLELRDEKFKSGEIDLIAAIALEFQNCGLPEYQECTKKLLDKGRLLILLDGLDEVPSDRLNLMTTQIRNLVDRYSDNRFVVSCRTAAYRNFNNFRRFINAATADFDDGQIKTFISKWFESHSQPEWGQQCWSKLNSGEHKATKELTRTPLLLTLICILFKKRGEFPNKRATVYNEALWTLLSEWDASKEIVRSTPYKGMDTKCKEVMLAEIAHDNFIADKLIFQQGEITQQIESILGEMLPDEKSIDGRVVLRGIEEQPGILVGIADDIYSFSHPTFQEFLTAKHINNVKNGINIEELISQHLCDRRWREVFLFMAGLREADNLLLAMEKKIYSLVDTAKLQDLLTWVEQVTDKTAGEFHPVGKRGFAYINALAYINAFTFVKAFPPADPKAFTPAENSNANVFDFTNPDVLALTCALFQFNFKAFTFFRVISNGLALDLVNVLALSEVTVNTNALSLADALVDANAFDGFIYYAQWSEKFKIYQDVNYSKLIATLKELKQQIPDDKEASEVRQASGQDIIQTWLTAFHLTPEMLDLSSEEKEALNNYLYANLLMVECKKEAVLISQPTWENIESRMLLPPKNQN